MNWTLVKHLVEYLVTNLGDSCLRIEPAGSFRRMKADCGDLEIVCVPQPGAPRPEFGQKRIFTSHLDLALYRPECEGRLGRRIKDGEKYKQIIIQTESFGIQTTELFKLDLFIVTPPAQWGPIFTIRTGPEDFGHWIVTPGAGGMPKGYVEHRGSVYPGERLSKDVVNLTGDAIPMPEEIDFLKFCGLPWIEPMDRRRNWMQA
jgi:DNA polymerase/3'-5' exonuclease PolX